MDLNLNTTERNSISVWFVCKSCESTFSFPTVDEFLEHKKEKHLVEFQKAQCIVFEERKQDEFFVRTDEDEETKLFAQGDDDEDRDVVVELCPGSGTSGLLSETAEPPSPAAPPPVPIIATLTPVKLSPSDSAIQTRGAAALKEKSRQENEFNGDFGLFSSRFNTSDDLVQNCSRHTGSETQLDQSHLDVENDSTDWSPQNLSSDPDFSVADSDADSDDSNVEDLIDPLSDNLLDTPSNSTLTNCLNPTLSNPFVLLRRLTAKELASWSSELIVSSNSPNKRKIKSSKKKRKPKRRENGGPFLCTICSSPFGNKTARGVHMRSHFETQSGPRPFTCSYPDCTASFRQAYILDRHKARHEEETLNPKLKSTVNKVFFRFPEPSQPLDPPSITTLTLRKWLCEQKKVSQNSNSSQTETETDPGNFILLHPDLTEMDETGAEAFKISRETPVQCRLCCQNLESAPHVQVHATHCWLRNKGRHRYCFPCNKVLSSRKCYRKHIKNKHSLVRKILTPEYSCPLCARKTTTQAYLRRHMKIHTRSKEERKAKTWVCEICGSAYTQQCLLKHHQRTHGEETSFKCPHPGCASAFKSKPNLNSHLRNHIRSKNYGCPKEGCSKSFKTKSELTIHLKRLSHSGVSRPGAKTKTKSWKCEHENCGKWFPDIPALNRHRISAHGVTTELPTFECHICGKTFTYKISLTRHVWTHTNDSPFKCTYEGCAKTYKDKTSLAEHIYTHTGERPYQCDLCGKDYNAKASLNRHLGWHQKNSHSEAAMVQT